MTYRNRPVLDRKHRPRWQDELRRQQLIVAGFALAIAVAIGIFAAAAWSSFYNANFRQVALVNGQSIAAAEMKHRADLVAATLSAAYIDLGGQLGGQKDQVIQQQMSAIQQALDSVEQVASDTLLTGMTLDGKAADYGISVPADELDAEVAKRRTIPERRKLSLILVKPEVDADAPAGSDPTDQDWADAKAEIDDVKSQLDGGATFADLATAHSDDPSKATQGVLGWIEADDTSFAEYWTAAKDAEAGAVLGPTRTDAGWYLLRVDDATPAHADDQLARFLDAANVSDAEYRDYVRESMLQTKFSDYFKSDILGKYQAQRNVAQILISGDETATAAAPKIHIRHLLAQPIPGADDQSTATQEQWDAALERAKQFRIDAAKPDADWYALAEESDDAGSRTRGGYLGWYDPGSLATQFVPEFAAAAGSLDVGELSEPIKSQYGYHIIEVTDRRASALELANRLVDELRADPDTFAEVARDQSEDPVTAKKGGELGWVIKYQYDAERQQAIFDLTDPGEISEPLITSSGIYIFKLIDTAQARYVTQRQRDQVASSGFTRWLGELKDSAHIWVDPEFAPTTSTTAAG
jgi:parvulin-like peptidyl-prolyl isomerase